MQLLQTFWRHFLLKYYHIISTHIKNVGFGQHGATERFRFSKASYDIAKQTSETSDMLQRNWESNQKITNN